jgi:threonine/homoserine/homoserine lactone efflux protein
LTLGIHDFGVFLLGAVILNLTPGQDTLYILGRALAEGRRAGLAAALGVSAGTALHALAAALGLSAIVAASEQAFVIMKLAGAAYLVYLGLGLLRTPRAAAADADVAVLRNAMPKALRQGIVTNVTNPKVALFFLAFLPQFVDASSPNRLAALLALGATFVCTSTAWCLLLAAAAGRARRAVSPAGGRVRWLRRGAGALLVALGLRLALAER